MLQAANDRTGGFDGEASADRETPRAPDDAITTIGEVAALIRDAGQDMLITASALGLVLAGAVLQLAIIRELPFVDGALGPVRMGLLAIVVVALLRSAMLLKLARRRMTDALGELRRYTGAPVNPAAPWTPFPPRFGVDPDAAWSHLRALVAAVQYRHFLVDRALGWAVTCVAMFLLWSVANLLAALM